MKSRKLTALLLAIAFVLGMAACGGAGEAPGASAVTEDGGAAPAESGEAVELSLTYWGAGEASPDPIDQLFTKTVADYNAANANVAIDLQYMSGDTYYTKLPAMVAANTAPDMFSIHASGKLKQYVDADRVLPLDSYLEADPAWRDKFVGGAFGLLTFEEQIFAVPWYTSAGVLFYNKEIFDAYGLVPATTYDELKTVVTTLRDNGVTPFAFGTKDAWTPALFAEIVANRIGGNKPYDDIMGGGGSWLDPSFVEMGGIMQELVTLGAFPEDYMGLGADNMQAMFKAGEAAMYVMGSWGIAQVYADDSLVKDKIAAANFPTFDGGTGDPNMWLGQPSVNIALAANTPYPDQAVDFLKFWTGDEQEKFLGEVCGQIPVTGVELDNSKVYPLAVEINGMIAESSGMFIFYDVGLGATIGDEFNNTVQSICAMNDVNEALGNLQTFTDENRDTI